MVYRILTKPAANCKNQQTIAIIASKKAHVSRGQFRNNFLTSGRWWTGSHRYRSVESVMFGYAEFCRHYEMGGLPIINIDAEKKGIVEEFPSAGRLSHQHPDPHVRP